MSGWTNNKAALICGLATVGGRRLYTPKAYVCPIGIKSRGR